MIKYCPYCGEDNVGMISSVSSNQETVTGVNENKPYKCFECKKEFLKCLKNT